MVMTDEERQKLVADLREFTGLDNEPWLVRAGRQAANEIERLAALAQSDEEPDPAKVICPNCAHQFTAVSVADQERLRAQSDALPREHQDPSKWVSREDMERAHAAQSDAGPVAWRVKVYGDSWVLCYTREEAFTEARNGNRIEPLYTAPPRPDASAGLIEAAKIAEEWDSGWGEDRNTRVARQTAIEIAEAIRARAADRSTK
jgi:hypothetical protein